MISNSRPRGRPAGSGAKQNLVLSHLRRKILAGKTPPGSRLPTRSELETHFNVSWLTVQRAFDRLKRDGFVRSMGRNGTYVADHPPHLFQYALLMESDKSEQANWTRYWTALCNEAAEVERRGPQRFRFYYNITGHADSEDYLKLLEDVRAQRLAGLIIGFPPSHLIGTPLLEDPMLPCVGLMLPSAPGVPVIDFDFMSFIDKALDYLQAQARTRIALVDSAKADYPHHSRFLSGLKARGMKTEPYWKLTLSHHNPQSAHDVMYLLLHDGQAERPDGIIICDDNLVEHAVNGIVSAGLHVPDEVEVVGHANFPWPPPSALPVKRCGCDTRRLVEQCMDLIDKQRAGERVPMSTKTLAVFEDEVKR